MHQAMAALTVPACVTATPVAQGEPFIPVLPFGGYFLEKVRTSDPEHVLHPLDDGLGRCGSSAVLLACAYDDDRLRVAQV